jgi:hypothetical protein
VQQTVRHWLPVAWNYHVERYNDQALAAKLAAMNELGQLGWEMIAQVHVGTDVFVTYKRPA